LCQQFQQDVVVYVIEEAFYVGLYHVTKLAKLRSYRQVIRRLPGASSRTITIAKRVEILFVYCT